MFQFKTNNELLPEWLNVYLDDFETTLCFPIIILIVACTAQFVLSQLFDIGYVCYQNLKSEPGQRNQANENEGVLMKAKGLLKGLGFGNDGNNRNCKEAPTNLQTPTRTHSQEEWDYLDDDDD